VRDRDDVPCSFRSRIRHTAAAGGGKAVTAHNVTARTGGMTAVSERQRRCPPVRIRGRRARRPMSRPVPTGGPDETPTCPDAVALFNTRPQAAGREPQPRTVPVTASSLTATHPY